MGVMGVSITSLTIVYSTVYSGADQRKHQSYASLAFVPVTRKIFPFEYVIMQISAKESQSNEESITLLCYDVTKNDGKCLCARYHLSYHYDDVIMTEMASQITSLTIVYLIVYSGTDQIKHQSSAVTGLLCGEFTGDRWIPHTKGQLRGKCFHLMTSSWCCLSMYSLVCVWFVITSHVIYTLFVFCLVMGNSIGLTFLPAKKHWWLLANKFRGCSHIRWQNHNKECQNNRVYISYEDLCARSSIKS